MVLHIYLSVRSIKFCTTAYSVGHLCKLHYHCLHYHCLKYTHWNITKMSQNIMMCHILSQRWKEMMLFKLNSQENRNRRKVFFRKPVKLTGFSWKLRLWPTNDLKWPQIFYLEAELVLGLILNILEFPLSTSMVSWNVSSVLVVVSLSLSWKRMFYPAFIPFCGR